MITQYITCCCYIPWILIVPHGHGDDISAMASDCGGFLYVVEKIPMRFLDVSRQFAYYTKPGRDSNGHRYECNMMESVILFFPSCRSG